MFERLPPVIFERVRETVSATPAACRGRGPRTSIKRFVRDDIRSERLFVHVRGRRPTVNGTRNSDD